MSKTTRLELGLALACILLLAGLFCSLGFQVQSSPGVTGGQTSGGGSGTVSANNGVANALAIYPAASGSTTVGASGDIVDQGTGTFTVGAVGASGNGTIQMLGSTSGTVQWACNAAVCNTISSASPVQLLSNSGVATKHLNQVAASNFLGTCTMAATTTCTITINSTYTTPVCFASVQSAAPTTFQGSAALSGTTLTITASASNSNTWGAFCAGNPT